MYTAISSARMSSTNLPGSQIRVTSCGCSPQSLDYPLDSGHNITLVHQTMFLAQNPGYSQTPPSSPLLPLFIGVGITTRSEIWSSTLDRVKMNGGPCFGGNSCGWCGSPYQNILCRPRGKSLPRSHAEAPYIDRVKTLCQISVIVFRR
jgi:hypothetical protein